MRIFHYDSVTMHDYLSCHHDWINEPYPIFDSHICISHNGSQCFGSHGDPLVCNVTNQYGEKTRILMGIFSFGSPLCDRPQSSIYTNIAYYWEFVKHTRTSDNSVKRSIRMQANNCSNISEQNSIKLISSWLERLEAENIHSHARLLSRIFKMSNYIQISLHFDKYISENFIMPLSKSLAGCNLI